MDADDQEHGAGNVTEPALDEAPSQVEMDVDIEGVVDVEMEDIPTQTRVPTPEDTITVEPAKRLSKKRQPASTNDRGTSSRKRLKKKSAAYDDDDADDDDFELEMRKQMEDKDADDDFIPPSPPPPTKKTTGKKAAGTGAGKKGKPKRGGSKGADIVITMKDERKTAASTSASAATEAVVIPSATIAGGKKRRDTADSVEKQVAAESAVQSRKSVTDASTSPVDPKPTPVKKKLPPIRKNKSLASTAPSSGLSTPSDKPAFPFPMPLHMTVNPASLPNYIKTADVNLADSNVYKELFKSSGTSAPRVGVNPREERHKELSKMRDQAREQRMTLLKVGHEPLTCLESSVIDSFRNRPLTF
ncbi:hypothetical protein SCHPADRAFT_707379 [Schizopora paradoxa]|uniref:Uncharacterized protein n=1 Tax=Schizopora paradoxa TaxID=27342 RepID=A0A0H2R8Z7_9AGAM|nr:hypothetical protein SCHPADRAFT_707379 [Schizopora paradoxa]